MESTVCCPKCGSDQITANKHGYSAGKAVAGAILTGGIGLLAGMHGSKKVDITCLACGNKFKPGQGKIVSTQIQLPQNDIQTKEILSYEQIEEKINAAYQYGGFEYALRVYQKVTGNVSYLSKDEVVKMIGKQVDRKTPLPDPLTLESDHSKNPFRLDGRIVEKNYSEKEISEAMNFYNKKSDLETLKSTDKTKEVELQKTVPQGVHSAPIGGYIILAILAVILIFIVRACIS